MNAAEAVREAAAESGFTMARLASVMGTIPQVVNGYLTRKNGMRADKLAEMAGALGYDLAMVPRGSRLPKGSIVVEAGPDD